MVCYRCVTCVLQMWYMCVTDVLHVGYRCGICVLQMWYMCVTDVLHVCYRCGICVLQMWYMCVTDVLHVCYRCGICVLGDTELEEDEGVDVCGICDGDGTSCLDCANEVDGESEVDNCGDCKLPTASDWNKGSLKNNKKWNLCSIFAKEFFTVQIQIMPNIV